MELKLLELQSHFERPSSSYAPPEDHESRHHPHACVIVSAHERAYVRGGRSGFCGTLGVTMTGRFRLDGGGSISSWAHFRTRAPLLLPRLAIRATGIRWRLYYLLAGRTGETQANPLVSSAPSRHFRAIMSRVSPVEWHSA